MSAYIRSFTRIDIQSSVCVLDGKFSKRKENCGLVMTFPYENIRLFVRGIQWPLSVFLRVAVYSVHFYSESGRKVVIDLNFSITSATFHFPESILYHKTSFI